MASVLPGHSKKDDKKSSAKAAAAAVGDDGSLVSFIAPSVGDRVTLMMRSKALSNVDGVVMVIFFLFFSKNVTVVTQLITWLSNCRH